MYFLLLNSAVLFSVSHEKYRVYKYKESAFRMVTFLYNKYIHKYDVESQKQFIPIWNLMMNI